MMNNKKYTKSLFPKVNTSLSFFLIISIIVYLTAGLVLSQRDIKKISNRYIPLIEYSSSLIKLNNDILYIVEDLRYAKGDEFTKKRARFFLIRGILDQVIASVSEIAEQFGLELHRRETIVKNEDKIIKNIRKVSAADYEKYRSEVEEFRKVSSEKIESILDTRDIFVGNLIGRNYLIFIIVSVAFLLWIFLFVRLAFIIIKNIKDKNSLLLEINDAKEDIEGLVRVISHDIATPLSVVFAYSNIDLDEGNSEVNRMKVESIKLCSKNIAEILSHVKNMQAIKDEKIELKLEEFDVVDVFEELEFIFKEKLSSKSITINKKFEKDDNIIISADRASFKNQVVANILSNCIKFSEHNSSIDISAIKETGKTIISISDYGIGMPESISKNIFGTKVKTSRQGLEGEEGTGFGMPILKVCMDKFGADIEVSSKCIDEFPDSSGTTFFLIFFH